MGTIGEKPRSMSGEVPYFDQTSVREFYAFGFTDANALNVGIAAAMGSIIPTFDVINGNVLFLEKYSYREAGGGCWDIIVHYRGIVNNWKISGDNGGGTVRKVESLETTYGYDCTTGDGAPPDYFDFSGIPNFLGAINVTETGVEGVDVPDYKDDFTIEQNLKLATISAGYIDMLSSLQGHVNDDIYTITWAGGTRIFYPEELKFNGAPYTMTSTEDISFSYKFSKQKSITKEDNQVIGQAVIEANGWQYVWTKYEKVADTTTGKMVHRPYFSYVERVIPTADFTLLAL